MLTIYYTVSIYNLRILVREYTAEGDRVIATRYTTDAQDFNVIAKRYTTNIKKKSNFYIIQKEYSRE